MRMLRHHILAAYAFPALPLAVLTIPVYIFLPTYYAQNAGLGLAVVGMILLAARLVDMVSDPLIGMLSDRTRTRYGARKPWVLCGTPLVMLAGWFVLMPGDHVGALYLLFWSICLYIGWSAVILPLIAWGAELSSDYDTRTHIAGWREFFMIGGVLLALALIAAGDDPLRVIALIVLILLPLAAAIACYVVPDVPVRRGTALRFSQGVDAIRKNAPFTRLMAAYLVNGLANGLPATLFLLFVQYGLGMPDQAGFFLFVYFASGLVAIPLWLTLSRFGSKHRVWCGAMIWACVFFLLVPFIGEGDDVLFLAVCILTGIALGADLVLPSAMQADIVDIDTLETGHQRTGLYFALWSMVTKLSLALAAGIAFPLLALAGFSADEGGSHHALVALYALLPVALKLFAIALMWRYPLGRDRLLDVQEKIREMP